MKRKKNKVFLDSNVILSGLFSDKGPPRLLLDILCLGLPMITGVTGRYNLIEIERNIKKRLPAALPLYQAYLTKLKMEIVPLPSQEDIRRFAGTTSLKDIPVIASAFVADADFLVTGDKEILFAVQGKHCFPFKIISPADFFGFTLPEILKRLEHNLKKKNPL